MAKRSNVFKSNAGVQDKRSLAEREKLGSSVWIAATQRQRLGLHQARDAGFEHDLARNQDLTLGITMSMGSGFRVEWNPKWRG